MVRFRQSDLLIHDVLASSMMLVRILLALSNSKLDPYGANLLIGKIFTDQSGAEKDHKTFLC